MSSPVRPGLADEVSKIVQGAQFGMDHRVPAFGGADGPGAAGFTRFADRRVVAALAVGGPDGVDGR